MLYIYSFKYIRNKKIYLYLFYYLALNLRFLNKIILLILSILLQEPSEYEIIIKIKLFN